MGSTIKLLALSTASLLALSPQAAFAQAGTGAEAHAIEEIVVTAQRRSESAQDVPISLTALSGEQLEAAVIDDVTDLKRLAPSFFAGSPPQVAGMRLNVRGLGSPGSVDPSVAVFVDGVYIARAGALLGNLLDIERVEILSGPQGTLFGRNASVGALSISTAAPTFTRSGSATIEYGTKDRLRTRAIATGPLSDVLAARLAVAYDTYDGYGVNWLNGERIGEQDALTARLGLRYADGPVDWTLRADYQEIFGDGVAVVTVDAKTVTPAAAANFNATTGGRAPRLTGTYDQVISQQAGGKLADRNYGLASDFNFEVGEHTLRLISGYREWLNHQNEEDVLYTAAPLLGRDVRFYSQTHSQELQLISPEDGRLTYVAGLYYFDEENGSTGSSNIGPAYCGVLAPPAQRAACNGALATGLFPAMGAGLWDLSQTTESYAVYGQGTYALTDAFDVTVGARYSRDEKTGRLNFTRPNPFLGTIVVPDAETLSADWDKFTWRLNATYEPTPDVMLFATYSTGYKSGGFDLSTGVAANANRTFQPETSDNYELGVKSQFLDRRLTANATIFRTSVDNLQVRSFDAASASFNTRNAGSVRQQGVEFELRARPIEGLTLGFAATYLDSEYTSFRNAPNLPGRPGTQDLTGHRSSFSPEWQGVVTAGYVGDLNEAFGFSLDGNLSFTDDQYVGGEADDNPQGYQPAYALLGARLAIYPHGRKWEFAVAGENLADEGYCVAKFTQPGAAAFGVISAQGGAVQRCILGQPRTIRASATVRF